MDQYELFGVVETTPTADTGMPDPKKYAHERRLCQHPQLAPSTAYSYGCRCRGCYKYHAAESYRRRQGPMPCAYPGCTNERRRVQRARYCEEHTTSRNYVAQGPVIIPQQCALCGEMKPIHKDKRYLICSSCHEANMRLVRQCTPHRVPLDTLLGWMRRPHCYLCDKRFYTGAGKGSTGFAVDHDHSCCHGATSCGDCIRGLLCMACNMSLGHVESMIGKATLERLLAYVNGQSIEIAA